MKKTRTITLTHRRPVKIDEEEWPILASASDDGHDGQYACQANRKWWSSIHVRQHADGRTLIYGRYKYSSSCQGDTDVEVRGGVLLHDGMATDNAIIAAVRDLATDLDVRCDACRVNMRELAHECIADLEPEAI